MISGLTYDYPHNVPTYVLSGWWWADPIVEGETTLFVQIDTDPVVILNTGTRWSQVSSVNNAIAVDNEDKDGLISTSDENGGMILAWQDSWSGDAFLSPHAYCQRMDHYGRNRWGGRLSLTNQGGSQSPVSVLGDGSGGAIIAFSGTDGLRAQHVSGPGQLLWGPAGVLLNGLKTPSGASTATGASIVRDGRGGAFFVWTDSRNVAATASDVYAQHIDAFGSPLWPTDGKGLIQLSGAQSSPVALEDGSGGFVCFWNDGRNSVASAQDIYAQRFSETGDPQWTSDGVPICAAAGNQNLLGTFPDGRGGAIGYWSDFSPNPGLYTQDINSSGVTLWPDNGVRVNSSGGASEGGVSDGKGGALFAYQAGPELVSANRVLASGAIAWGSEGVIVRNLTDQSLAVRAVSNERGGLIAAWADGRAKLNGGDDMNQYAQCVDSTGATVWTNNGVPVTTAFDNQIGNTMVSDGAGGAILAWTDIRNKYPGRDYYLQNIYGQRIDAKGRLGCPEPILESLADVPGDQGGLLRIGWAPSQLEQGGRRDIDRYRIWQRVGLSSPSLINSVSTIHQCDYAAAVPSPNDSIGDRPPSSQPSPTVYWVEAANQNGSESWSSLRDSSLSVDNVAPDTVTVLNTTISPTLATLHWVAPVAPDLANYRVAHAEDSAAPMDSAYDVVGNPTTTEFIDNSPDPSKPHYWVTAEDVHGNTSPFVRGQELFEPDSTSLPQPPSPPPPPAPPDHLILMPAAPNPSGGNVSIHFQLPAYGWVDLRIFNIAGAKVRSVKLWVGDSSVQNWIWDGRNDDHRAMPSGVYVCRVSSPSGEATKGFVLVR